MSNVDIGKKFLSDLKLHSDYLKWVPEKGRYETWEEACEDVINNTYRRRYPQKLVQPMIDQALHSYKRKLVLASQRSLQYRSAQIDSHNGRQYNCCTTYCYSPDVFAKGFYVLLCGEGLGVSLHSEFVSQLPSLTLPTKGTKTFVVQDTIEGWADAANALISSFCASRPPVKEYQGYSLKFDTSLIRPKGSFISGGFKAPGPDGLIASLSKIETLLTKAASVGEFTDIVAYDIFMHLSNAVLSGGIRRAAMNVMFGDHQIEMMNAKIGNWFEENPQRARSNNSVMLLRDTLTKEHIQKVVDRNIGQSDLGFVFVNNIYEIFNPCYEIKFGFYHKIQNKKEAVFQKCNLNEINASACIDEDGAFCKGMFYRACVDAAVIGTMQAGVCNFPYLGQQTNDIVAGEALLGVSITGWMDRPELFDPAILQKGAEIVKVTNRTMAHLIGINPAARTTCVKPSGNSSVILSTTSGIHPEHSPRFFRIMQLNKEAQTAKWLEENMPELLEESVWSATKSDYGVFVPVTASLSAIFKSEMVGVRHLELVKLVQENWVKPGKTEELCYDPTGDHNVSVTVIIDDVVPIVDYLYEHRDSFTAVSFLSPAGDKDYNQAPFTSVLTSSELLATYGDGVLFASGLIVDGLHYFDGDLWRACEHVKNRSLKFEGSRDKCLLQKDWVRRAKKFAKNYHKGKIDKMIYCLKDVHLWHKWCTIAQEFKPVDFGTILTMPSYSDVGDYAAAACSGGACEI